MEGPHKAIGRQKTGRNWQEGSWWKEDCFSETVRFAPGTGHLCPTAISEKWTVSVMSSMISQGLLAHGGSHRENHIKGHDNGHLWRSVFEPWTISVHGHSVHSSLVLRFLAHVCWPCYPLLSLNKPAISSKEPA